MFWPEVLLISLLLLSCLSWKLKERENDFTSDWKFILKFFHLFVDYSWFRLFRSHVVIGNKHHLLELILAILSVSLFIMRQSLIKIFFIPKGISVLLPLLFSNNFSPSRNNSYLIHHVFDDDCHENRKLNSKLFFSLNRLWRLCQQRLLCNLNSEELHEKIWKGLWLWWESHLHWLCFVT